MILLTWFKWLWGIGVPLYADNCMFVGLRALPDNQVLVQLDLWDGVVFSTAVELLVKHFHLWNLTCQFLSFPRPVNTDLYLLQRSLYLSLSTTLMTGTIPRSIDLQITNCVRCVIDKVEISWNHLWTWFNNKCTFIFYRQWFLLCKLWRLPSQVLALVPYCQPMTV